jgi:hypothetical protein
MSFHSTGNPGSSSLVRDNGNGTVTIRTYQDVSDRKQAERVQHQENAQKFSYQEKTVDKP